MTGKIEKSTPTFYDKLILVASYDKGTTASSMSTSLSMPLSPPALMATTRPPVRRRHYTALIVSVIVVVVVTLLWLNPDGGARGGGRNNGDDDVGRRVTGREIGIGVDEGVPSSSSGAATTTTTVTAGNEEEEASSSSSSSVPVPVLLNDESEELGGRRRIEIGADEHPLQPHYHSYSTVDGDETTPRAGVMSLSLIHI